MGKSKSESWGEKIEQKLLPLEPLARPLPITLIIPVYNCSEVIGATLESVENQAYAPLEVIVIDAGSTDRTLEVVNSYAALITRVYTVAKFNIAEMCNRGVSLASGEYVTFLFPGSFYLSRYAYHTLAQAAESHNFPDLTYCGSIEREMEGDSRHIFENFNLETVEKGRNPATIPGCLYRRDLFERVGRFHAGYTLRPGFDFFCRVACEEGLRIQPIDRVFIDFDYGRFTYGKALKFAVETWQILFEHFGFRRAFVWFLALDHIAMVRWVWRSLKRRLFE